MIYCCRVSNDPDITEQALKLCSSARREKAQRLKTLKARSLSIAAGILLRYCLLKEGIDDTDAAYSESGKPFIRGNKLFVSLSHSGEYAACATSKKPIGIDIQEIVDTNDRTVSRFCTESELAWVEQSICPKTAAITLWTLKESYLKASGCGRAEAFAAEFEICGDHINGPKGYEFEVSKDIEGYVVAVCRAV